VSDHCLICGVVKVRCVSYTKYCLDCAPKASGLGGAKAAWLAVNKAVKRGELRPAREQKCADCGKQAAHYDHRDYSKPLAVDPVCRSCNRKRGPGLRFGGRVLPAELFTTAAA
jgi:hypothetical protein